MAPLKLSNLFRRDPDRQTLKERAAATAGRIRGFETPPSVDGEKALATLEEMATLDFAAYSLDTPTREREAPPEMPQDDERAADFSLVSMLDLASATIDELQSLHDLADRIGGAAYAFVWTGRCKKRGCNGDFNVAGELMQWLGDALTDVETAAINEARRRSPMNRTDRETRLKILAVPVVQNGDPDETEAFARDLLAHAEAERAGR